MKIAYIMMRFPSAPETFACSDICALRNGGLDVTAYAMRGPQADPVSLLVERRLSGLVVSQGTLGSHIEGLYYCFAHPALVASVLLWLLRSVWRQPRELFASIVLVPRSVGIFLSLRRERPDVVHLFWGHYPCIVGYLVRTRMPDTVLSVFLGAYDLTRAYGGSGWVVRRADLVWTHARCNVAAIKALGGRADRIHVAYRGVDLTLFRPDGRKVPRRIVTVGRLIQSKGMEQVLLAYRQIQAGWPMATLVIIGEGPERARLERLSRSLGIEATVTFMGHLRQQDVANEMAAAEVFLLMSRKESERLPNVVKEAMASRCVCVVAETPGIDELLANGRHGFLVPQDDAESAAARIADVFSGRVEVRSLLDAAAHHVTQAFDVTTNMTVYRGHWETAVRARRFRLASAGRPTPGSEQVSCDVVESNVLHN